MTDQDTRGLENHLAAVAALDVPQAFRVFGWNADALLNSGPFCLWFAQQLAARGVTADQPPSGGSALRELADRWLGYANEGAGRHPQAAETLARWAAELRAALTATTPEPPARITDEDLQRVQAERADVARLKAESDKEWAELQTPEPPADGEREPIYYMGQGPNQGRIVIQPTYPGEGYAILRCGGTEVQIGYTTLHHTRIQIDGVLTEPIKTLSDLQRAIYAIAAEAAMGRTGEREPSGGIDMIAAERRRQVEREGWTAEHDDQHIHDQLARAAALYALPGHCRDHQTMMRIWPWSWDDWKPEPSYADKPVPLDKRIRSLVKAGALIAAEIDRLLRSVASTEKQSE